MPQTGRTVYDIFIKNFFMLLKLEVYKCLYGSRIHKH